MAACQTRSKPRVSQHRSKETWARSNSKPQLLEYMSVKTLYYYYYYDDDDDDDYYYTCWKPTVCWSQSRVCKDFVAAAAAWARCRAGTRSCRRPRALMCTRAKVYVVDLSSGNLSIEVSIVKNVRFKSDMARGGFEAGEAKTAKTARESPWAHPTYCVSSTQTPQL